MWNSNLFWCVAIFCFIGCSQSLEPIQLDKLPEQFSITTLKKNKFLVEGVGYTLENVIEYKIEKSRVTYLLDTLLFTAGFRGYVYENGKWPFFYITDCDSQIIDIITSDSSSYVSRYKLVSSENVQKSIGDEIIFNEKLRLKLIVNRTKKEIYVSRI